MIERYSRTEMKHIWSEEQKYVAWAQVERAHLSVCIESEGAPQRVLSSFDKAFASKKEADYLQREEETGHDVIAFVAEVGEAMGDCGSYLHKGLTSSDVVDTAFALRMVRALKHISQELFLLKTVLAEQAFNYSSVLCMGRTHGIHAEPMSFGQVLASHFAEFQRASVHISEALTHVSYGKLSGAVGAYSQLKPEFERMVLEKLNLQVETVSTQIIPRDRFLMCAYALLTCSSAIERFATNIRHLARTELGEVFEPFSVKQKGSSAMPHKKNPILSENLCGLARTIRGYFNMISENSALWHERDISHSSVERVAFPDMFVTLDFMLGRTTRLIKNMYVNKEALANNIAKTGGLWASGSVLTALVNLGLGRTESYEKIQSICLAISKRMYTEQLPHNELLQKLQSDPTIARFLTKESFKNIFDLERFLECVPTVFKRVFGTDPESYFKNTAGSMAERIPVLKN